MKWSRWIWPRRIWPDLFEGGESGQMIGKMDQGNFSQGKTVQETSKRIHLLIQCVFFVRRYEDSSDIRCVCRHIRHRELISVLSCAMLR